ncbi:MAG: DMT family transporter [Gammaproteobacteria bacterium]
MTEPDWRRGLYLTLATVACWAVLPVALKALLVYMDPWTITWYRFLVAAVLLGGWLLIRAGLPRRGRVALPVVALLAAAVFGLVGNYVLYLLGLSHIQPGSAQVLIQLAPMFLLLGGLFLFGERFRRRQWVGLSILVAGLVIFFHDRLALLASPDAGPGRGFLLIVAAAVAWACYGLAQKKLGATLSPAVVLVVVYVAAVPLLLPAARPAAVLELDGAALGLLAFCSVNTLVAYGCFAEAIRAWEASRVSAVLAITPLATLGVVAVAHSWFPDHVPPEPIDALAFAGALLVVAGSATTALAGARSRKTHD